MELAVGTRAVRAGAEQALLREIVVTAQERESALQQTDVSITALSASGLEERGVARALGLTEYVPNVDFQLNTIGNGLFVSS